MVRITAAEFRRAALQQKLSLVLGDIKAGRGKIAKQRETIAKLKARGHDTSKAVGKLTMLERAQASNIVRHYRTTKELGAKIDLPEEAVQEPSPSPPCPSSPSGRYIDRASLGEQLSMATENVRWDIEVVRKQREKVQWLERRGHDTAQAKKVLDAAEDLLLLHMADRERLLEELNGGRWDWER
jgi:hypothetical protein